MQRIGRLAARAATAVLFCFAAIGSAPASDAELKPWTGAPQAPAIVLPAPDGTTLALEKWRGRVVLVNFWASWCEPCVEEMPAMQLLRERFDRSRFEILAVNFREHPQRIESFMKRMDIDFPVVRDDDGSVARNWGVRVFPSSFIVDATGRIRLAAIGPVDWTASDVEARIRALLSPASAGGR